ncbi:MAG: MBL fold metallo-hydrolase [Candidatus Giovannonibacteria bacterium]|nr:MBL fold metallo-hydrolase [Candidatus Giovannonibacteria bacterium]
MTKLSFYGAAQEVTGSCFLLESPSTSSGQSTKILVDCGLFQCPKFCDIRSHDQFPFDPKEIEALFVTHAHVDHTGRIPKLVKDGFRGKIYSTHPTKDLAELMLKDSVMVMAKEAEREGGEVPYAEEDIGRVMSFWEGKNYHEKIQAGDFAVTFYDAGHVLGSAMILVETGGLPAGKAGKKILFSGDLGNPANPLLNGFEKVSGAEVLVLESTYGDREHEGIEEKKLLLERVIEKSVVKGGVLMIPAFSLEKTQELLWEISDMLRKKEVPNVQIFLDSPLAIRATEVYQKYYSYLNKAYVDKKSFSFLNFPQVHVALTADESKKINGAPAPKIIIAGSGMSTGGRILHHERRYLRDPKSTILFIGYQAPGSLGRRIQDGADEVMLFGEKVPVRCRKETIYGYSAHPDYAALFEFVREKSDTLQKIYTTHGEPKSSLALVQKLRDNLGIPAYAPKYGESVEI